jgi:hypothetical protein
MSFVTAAMFIFSRHLRHGASINAVLPARCELRWNALALMDSFLQKHQSQGIVFSFASTPIGFLAMSDVMLRSMRKSDETHSVRGRMKGIIRQLPFLSY